MKVLIVEDDQVIADGMSRHLRAAGLDPVWVPRGLTGLSRLRYERPDVCVLDLMLPEVALRCRLPVRARAEVLRGLEWNQAPNCCAPQLRGILLRDERGMAFPAPASRPSAAAPRRGFARRGGGIRPRARRGGLRRVLPPPRATRLDAEDARGGRGLPPPLGGAAGGPALRSEER